MDRVGRAILVLALAGISTGSCGCRTNERGPSGTPDQHGGFEVQSSRHGVAMLDKSVGDVLRLMNRTAKRTPTGQVQVRVQMQNLHSDETLWADVRFVFFDADDMSVDQSAWGPTAFPHREAVMVQGTSLRNDVETYSVQFKNLCTKSGQKLRLPPTLVERGRWRDTIPVSGDIADQGAVLSGTPIETLRYFAEKHPPESWQLEPGPSPVAVGPMCLSREAVVMVTGDTPEEISARGDTGGTRAIVRVRGGGHSMFFYVAETSEEVKSIVLEELINSAGTRVFAMGYDDITAVLEGRTSYEELYEKGIRYYVDGTVVTTGDTSSPTRVHLRFTDTATREIVCATTGEGGGLPVAARSAAVALVRGLQQGEQMIGGS